MKLYGFAIGAFTLSLLASCSNNTNVNEPDMPEEELPAMQLAQAPDLVIWNSNEVFAGNAPQTKATRATTKYQNDEVEVNLAIQDVHEKYDVADLVSHLSIHVRSNTDVEVVLPVPSTYYCDQDDLYIYNERNVDNWELEVSENSLTATIGEGENAPEVTLTVAFNDGNITIKTSGITNDVLAAVTAEDGDIVGINFDVYNYFNRGNQYSTGSYAEWTLQGLKNALDGSTIEFVLKESKNQVLPDYYINAFTGDKVTYNGTTVDRDCTVKPVEDQIESFYAPSTGENGFNQVYVNRTFPGILEPEQPEE